VAVAKIAVEWMIATAIFAYDYIMYMYMVATIIGVAHTVVLISL